MTVTIETTSLDYPFLRAALICPLCQHDKPQGCVTCWACYGHLQMRYGMSDATAATLKAAEREAFYKTNYPRGWASVEGGACTVEQWDIRNLAGDV